MSTGSKLPKAEPVSEVFGAESESGSSSGPGAGTGQEAKLSTLTTLESASAQGTSAGWAGAGEKSRMPGADSSDSEDFPEEPPPFLGTWKNIYWFLAIQMFVFAALFYWLTRWAE